MTTSASAAASAVSRTVRPSSSAFGHDFESRRRPTRTSNPESCRFSACACPWLPYPSTATFWSSSADRSMSRS